MHDAVEESPAKSGSSPIRRTTATSRNTTSPLSDCRKQWLFVPTGRTKASESRQPPRIKALVTASRGTAVVDHPRVHVLASDAANRNDAAVLVAIALIAGDRTSGNPLAKRPGRGDTTAPCLPAGAAGLFRFRGVDAMETNLLSTNPEGVPVGHTRDPRNLCPQRLRPEEGDKRERSGYESMKDPRCPNRRPDRIDKDATQSGVEVEPPVENRWKRPARPRRLRRI